jgi:uncharacterized protein (TIGR00251 family)
MLRVTPVNGGVQFSVRLQPRASTSRVVGVHGDALKVRVTAPPVDSAANEMLVKVLAATFGISANAITILSGAKSRTKLVRLSSVTEADVTRIVANSKE